MLWNSLQRRQLAQHGAGRCANYLQYSISAYRPFLWNTNLKIKHFIKMWIVGLLFNFSLFGFWSKLKKEKKKRVRNNVSRSVILEHRHWGTVIHSIYLVKLECHVAPAQQGIRTHTHLREGFTACLFLWSGSNHSLLSSLKHKSLNPDSVTRLTQQNLVSVQNNWQERGSEQQHLGDGLSRDATQKFLIP